MITLNLHEITKIELTNEFPENGNSRTLRVHMKQGHPLELVFYGETEALSSVPHSPDFMISHLKRKENA